MSDYNDAVWDIEIPTNELKSLIEDKVQTLDTDIQAELRPEIDSLFERIEKLQTELKEIQSALK